MGKLAKVSKKKPASGVEQESYYVPAEQSVELSKALSRTLEKLEEVVARDTVNVIREGILWSRIQPQIKKLGLTLSDLAHILQVSERTIGRYTPETRLDRHASERILLLENLIGQGRQAFDSNLTHFATWLRRPNRQFDHQTPLSLLDTFIGFMEVNQALIRYDNGVYI